MKWLLQMCIDHKLTINQFIFLYSLEKDREVLALIKIYAKGCFLSPTEKETLQSEGWVDEYENGKFLPSSKFQNILTEPMIIGEELVSTYPSYAVIKGVTVPLKAGNRKAFRENYCNSIGNNLKLHKEIMEALLWAKTQDILKMSISNFIESESWRDLLTMKKENNTTKIVSNSLTDDI